MTRIANPKFKELSPDRNLTPDEELELWAEYQVHHDIPRACRILNVTVARGWHYITAQLAEHPEVLTDPKCLMNAAVLFEQLANAAYDRGLENMKDLTGRAAVGAVDFAMNRKEKYAKAYMAAVGAGQELNEDQLRKEKAELEKQLAALGGTEGPEATPATDGTAGGESAN